MRGSGLNGRRPARAAAPTCSAGRVVARTESMTSPTELSMLKMASYGLLPLLVIFLAVAKVWSQLTARWGPASMPASTARFSCRRSSMWTSSIVRT